MIGDVLISSAIISYLGPFSQIYRDQIIKKWLLLCQQYNIAYSANFSLQQTFGNAVEIRNWIMNSLPNDIFSIDSAIIMKHSVRYPLLLDPEGQALLWIKSMEKDSKLIIVKSSDNYVHQMETAITLGLPILIENVGQDIDTNLEPILLKQTYKHNNVISIKYDDHDIEYSPYFHLYLATKLRNPHYLPEVSTKVCLLNFNITLNGLQDQLLSIVVKQELPQLEIQRNQLIITSANNANKLLEIENQILKVLEESKSNILDDQQAISVLSQAKDLSIEIVNKQKITKETELEINENRQSYIAVAKHASVLFFVTRDLGYIDPMYQYSLVWFINLFEISINKATKSKDIQIRIAYLNDYFRFLLYSNVCRSLFEQHKLLFSLLLAVRLKISEQIISTNLWKFF